MSDRLLAVLDAGGRFALLTDNIQWMLARSRCRDGTGGWKPFRFCTTSEALRRDVREAGIVPTAEAADFLSRLPAYRRDWTPPAGAAVGQPTARTQRNPASTRYPSTPRALDAPVEAPS